MYIHLFHKNNAVVLKKMSEKFLTLLASKGGIDALTPQIWANFNNRSTDTALCTEAIWPPRLS